MLDRLSGRVDALINSDGGEKKKKFSCNSVLKSNFPLFIAVAEDGEIVWKLQWVMNPEDPTTMLHAYTHNWTRISSSVHMYDCEKL